MPQLPSGQHIGLDPSPLQSIVNNAYDGIQAHELMAIETMDQLFKHINILFYRANDNGNDGYSLSELSIKAPDGFIAYESGYNLVTIKGVFDQWGQKDQCAFLEFLNESRTNSFFEAIFESIVKYQKGLTDNPSTLQGLLAMWWKLGVHPLQETDDR